MDKVRVVIIGRPNTGKTTIAHIVKAALEEQGFKQVAIHDIPATDEEKEPIHERLKKNRERPIDIEVQLVPAKFAVED